MGKNILNNLVEFTVKGNNFSNLLNTISFHKIEIQDCKIIRKNILKFTILKINESKIFDLLKNSCYTFNVREKRNFSYYVLSIMSNLGIILTLGVFIILACFYPYYIWDIKIYCENPNLYIDIKEHLKQENINLGISKSLVDKSELEYLLLQNFSQLSQVDISFEGGTLVINVKEKLSEALEEDFTPLISEYNGKVVSIELVSGTALVCEDDYIKIGDILVQPFMIDESGNTLVCKPQATIEIETYFESSIFYDEKGESLSRTKEKKTVNGIELCGMDIGLNNNSPYEYYEIEEKEILLSNILPIKILSRTYYELKYTKNSLKLDEILNELILKCENELNFVDKLNAERIQIVTKINESCYNIGVAYKQLVYQSR